jgi:nitrogen fixation protein NifU and related proteins
MATLSPYNEILLRHQREPAHHGIPSQASVILTETNRVCGDHVRIGFHIEDGHITHIGHESDGCLLCRASVSVLCQTLHGAPENAVPDLYKAVARLTDFHQSLPDEAALETAVYAASDAKNQLQDIQALAEVRKFPTRRKCVMMSWDLVGRFFEVKTQ